MNVKIGVYQTNALDTYKERIDFFTRSDIMVFSSAKELKSATCHLYLLHSSEPDDISFLYRDEPFKNKWKISYSGGSSKSQVIVEENKLKISSVTYDMLSGLLPSFIMSLKQKPSEHTITMEDLYILLDFDNELEKNLKNIIDKRSGLKGQLFQTPYENALSSDIIELNEWLVKRNEKK